MYGKGNKSTDGNNGTHEVATRVSNALGLYDMCENVNEWCFEYISITLNWRAGRGDTGIHRHSNYRSDMLMVFTLTQQTRE